MAASGEVVLLAHDSVGPPGDGVGDARGDLETAARTAIRLLGAGGGDRLNVPLAVALVFDSRSPQQGSGEIELG